MNSILLRVKTRFLNQRKNIYRSSLCFVDSSSLVKWFTNSVWHLLYSLIGSQTVLSSLVYSF